MRMQQSPSCEVRLLLSHMEDKLYRAMMREAGAPDPSYEPDLVWQYSGWILNDETEHWNMSGRFDTYAQVSAWYVRMRQAGIDRKHLQMKRRPKPLDWEDIR